MAPALLPYLLLLAQQPAAPPQPVAYSHRVHAGTLQLKCSLCHTNPNPGEMMQFPKVATCMTCHAAVKTDSPEIQKLSAAAKEGREINWVRVYQIPGYVNFSHRSHLETGSQCADCHGKVATRDALFKEGDISMGGCMSCHRLKKASIDCTFCHEQRQ